MTKVIGNTLKIIYDIFDFTFNTIKYLINGTISLVYLLLAGLAKLAEWGTFGSWKTAFENMASAAYATANRYAANAGEALNAIGKTATDVWDILKTGESNVSDVLLKFKKGIIDINGVVEELKGLFDQTIGEGNTLDIKVPTLSFSEGWKQALKEMTDSLENFGETGKQAFNNLVNSMRTNFATFFNDAFLGNLKKGREYFAEFGRAILAEFSKVLAQMVVRWILAQQMFKGGGGVWGILSAVLGAFGGGGATSTGASTAGAFSNPTVQFGGRTLLMHQGGVVSAHNGLAVDEVPIIAQRGEGIVSRRGMANMGMYEFDEVNKGKQKRESVVININPVIQAWDASDIMRNRVALTNVISESIRNNSSIRRIIKEYG